VTRHQKRVDDLVRVKSAGGFGLSPDAPQLRDETAKLERATAERDRLNALDEIRSAKWNVIARLERSTVEWLTRGGIPATIRRSAI
jgi:hypothetical protein